MTLQPVGSRYLRQGISEDRGIGGADVYVCICRVVSSTTVRAAIADGARTVREVALACGASQDCGRCVAHVRALLEEHHGPRARGRLEGRP